MKNEKPTEKANSSSNCNLQNEEESFKSVGTRTKILTLLFLLIAMKEFDSFFNLSILRN